MTCSRLDLLATVKVILRVISRPPPYSPTPPAAAAVSIDLKQSGRNEPSFCIAGTAVRFQAACRRSGMPNRCRSLRIWTTKRRNGGHLGLFFFFFFFHFYAKPHVYLVPPHSLRAVAELLWQQQINPANGRHGLGHGLKFLTHTQVHNPSLSCTL
jgi:hypothetical protein